MISCPCLLKLKRRKLIRTEILAMHILKSSHKTYSTLRESIIVFTGGIRWILWFSICYAAAAARREIFGVNALRGKLHQLGSPNLQDISLGGKLLWEEISLILKNKMAAAGISLKIINIFILAVSHRKKVECLHR